MLGYALWVIAEYQVISNSSTVRNFKISCIVESAFGKQIPHELSHFQLEIEGFIFVTKQGGNDFG